MNKKTPVAVYINIYIYILYKYIYIFGDFCILVAVFWPLQIILFNVKGRASFGGVAIVNCTYTLTLLPIVSTVGALTT